MSNKKLAILEAQIASWENDVNIFNENLALDQLEQEVLAEMDENEEKMAMLLENPTNENKHIVLNYLKSLIF